MNDMTQSQEGEALTGLILTLFRANNLTLVWGDRLVTPFGLTSARWQILGAIALSESPQPVAWIARDLGANRQNVQRIVNDLQHEGLVTLEPNPHHKRAHLVVAIAAASDDVDLAFVMTLQSMRFIIVLLFGPPVARWLAGRAGPDR